MLAVLKIAKIVTGGFGVGDGLGSCSRQVYQLLFVAPREPPERVVPLSRKYQHGSKGCNRATSHAVALVAQYGCGAR